MTSCWHTRYGLTCNSTFEVVREAFILHKRTHPDACKNGSQFQRDWQMYANSQHPKCVDGKVVEDDTHPPKQRRKMKIVLADAPPPGTRLPDAPSQDAPSSDAPMSNTSMVVEEVEGSVVEEHKGAPPPPAPPPPDDSMDVEEEEEEDGEEEDGEEEDGEDKKDEEEDGEEDKLKVHYDEKDNPFQSLKESHHIDVRNDADVTFKSEGDRDDYERTLTFTTTLGVQQKWTYRSHGSPIYYILDRKFDISAIEKKWNEDEPYLKFKASDYMRVHMMLKDMSKVSISTPTNEVRSKSSLETLPNIL